MAWNTKRRAPGACALLAVLAATLVLFTQAAPARAGDDSSCYSIGVGDNPADGAVDVVRNPMIVIQDQLVCTDLFCGFSDHITLRDASDYEILVYQQYLVNDGCIPVYFPETPLDPETTYCIDEEWICFTTGTTFDRSAPAFELGPDSNDSGLYVEWTGSQDIVMITMQVRSLGLHGIAMNAESPLDESSWAHDDGDTIMLTAWDRAGNSTTQPVTLRIPHGCQTGAGLQSPLIFALALLIGLLRRRRSFAHPHLLNGAVGRVPPTGARRPRGPFPRTVDPAPGP